MGNGCILVDFISNSCRIFSLLAQRTLNPFGAAGDKVVILRSLLTHADGLSFVSLNRLNFVNIVTLYLLLILNYRTEFVLYLSHTHTHGWFVCSSCVTFSPYCVCNLFICFFCNIVVLSSFVKILHSAACTVIHDYDQQDAANTNPFLWTHL